MNPVVAVDFANQRFDQLLSAFIVREKRSPGSHLPADFGGAFHQIYLDVDRSQKTGRLKAGDTAAYDQDTRYRLDANHLQGVRLQRLGDAGPDETDRLVGGVFVAGISDQLWSILTCGGHTAPEMHQNRNAWRRGVRRTCWCDVAKVDEVMF